MSQLTKEERKRTALHSALRKMQALAVRKHSCEILALNAELMIKIDDSKEIKDRILKVKREAESRAQRYQVLIDGLAAAIEVLCHD